MQQGGPATAAPVAQLPFTNAMAAEPAAAAARDPTSPKRSPRMAGVEPEFTGLPEVLNYFIFYELGCVSLLCYYSSLFYILLLFFLLRSCREQGRVHWLVSSMKQQLPV